MKVLILDTIHGGKILAENYLKAKNEVTAVDVYKATSKENLVSLRHRGARIKDTVPDEHFDLVVMPCHCPDSFLDDCTYGRRIFFSEAVGELLRDRRFRIEITGVKGKTSTCYLLAHILDSAGRKVFLHSSDGLGPYIGGKHIVTDYQSISPVSLLALPKGEYEILVCETSLGGSGKADIAGITNLADDYGIAAGTRRAELGKSHILTSRGVTFVQEKESGIWNKYGHPIKTVRNRIFLSEKPEFGKPTKVEIEYGERYSVELPGEYLALQYFDAISMVLEICGELGLSSDCVLRGLSSFKGVPGRGTIVSENGIDCLLECNPGVSAIALGNTFSCLEHMGVLDKAVLVVNPDGGNVCDRMDLDAIVAIADKNGIPTIVGNESDQALPTNRSLIVLAGKKLPKPSVKTGNVSRY